MDSKIKQKNLKILLESQDKNLNKKLDQFFLELRNFYARYFAEVQFFISSASDTKRGPSRLVELHNMADEIQRVFVEAGLGDVLLKYRDLYPEAAKQAIDYFQEMGIDPNKISRGININNLETIIQFDVEQVTIELNRKLVQPIRSMLIQNSLGTKTAKEITKDIKKQIDEGGVLRKDGKYFTDANIEVLVDNSIQNFRAYVITERGTALGLDIYEYRGPYDDRTRPACQFLLTYNKNGAPGFFYSDEITSSLYPDLEGDPLITRGGYNCRHAFYPVPLEYAQGFGFVERNGS